VRHLLAFYLTYVVVKSLEGILHTFNIVVAIGSRLLYSIQKTYFTNRRHLHVTGSLSHTVHSNYEEFLLVSLPFSLEILMISAVLHSE
jgi:hypothetical protein